jgi:hypothetical protein
MCDQLIMQIGEVLLPLMSDQFIVQVGEVLLR